MFIPSRMTIRILNVKPRWGKEPWHFYLVSMLWTCRPLWAGSGASPVVVQPPWKKGAYLKRYLCKWSKVGTCKATQAVDLCAELGHCVLWVNLGSCSSFYSKRFAMRFKSLQVNTLGYMDVATSFPSFQPAYTCCLSDMGRIKHSSRQEIYRTKKVDGEGRIAI